LDQGWTTIRLSLPEQDVRAGWNRIEFRSVSPDERRRVVDGDAGMVILACHELQITGGTLPPSVPEKALLRLEPTASSVDGKGAYIAEAPFQLDGWLMCPADGELVFTIECLMPQQGAGTVTIEAVAADESGAQQTIACLELDPLPDDQLTLHRTCRAPLPTWKGKRMMLQVRCLPGAQGWPAGATVSLQGPVVMGAPVSGSPAVSGRPLPPPATIAEQRPSPRWNIVLYVIDALRADQLGAAGHPGGFTPFLDQTARNSGQFADVWAAASWTRSSVATLLTGLYPSGHGALGRDQDVVTGTATVAAVLAEQGYRTAAFITNGNVDVAGLRHGFGDFIRLPENLSSVGIHQPADAIRQPLAEWLDRAPDAPFFVYAHASDPHAPYTPVDHGASVAHGRRLAPVRAGDLDTLYEGCTPPDDEFYHRAQLLYQAEVRANDAAWGRLLHLLSQRGLLDTTLLVVTSDHGEEFGEHGGLEHGKTLFSEQLQVPLLMRQPGGKRWLSLGPVSLADVAPTLVAVATAGSLARTDGLPLFIRPGGAPQSRLDREIFAELALDDYQQVAVRHGQWKAIAYGKRQRWDGVVWPPVQLFDLISDAGDQHDLAVEHPVISGWFNLRAADHLVRRRADAPTVVYDPAQEEALRALGYLN